MALNTKLRWYRYTILLNVTDKHSCRNYHRYIGYSTFFKLITKTPMCDSGRISSINSFMITMINMLKNCPNQIVNPYLFYITITILDVHHPVFYLKHKVLETAFCPCLQVEPTQLCPMDRASLSPDMDNDHNCDSYINIPLSQTYRSYTSHASTLF
jgi:hypothetical protein